MRAFGLALLVACGPPTPVPPKVPAALALPGACVDPLVDARQRLGPDAHDGPLRVERMVDLDGDGTTDPYVTHEVFCGTGGCQTGIFASDDEGGYVHVWDKLAQKIEFKTVGKRPAMTIYLHGSKCGRNNSQRCSMTLYWNGEEFHPAN